MRSTAETLELDASLRQSRTIYIALAVIVFPAAVAGVLNIFTALGAIVESLTSGYFEALGRSILLLVFGIGLVWLEYMVVAQSLEATRRLKVLRDHPEQKVRKLPAPFQASLFGPYH